MEMITIRQMTEQDDIVVSRIVSDCFRLIADPDGFTPDQLDRMLSERGSPENMKIYREKFTCYVAEIDSVVVGFVAFSPGEIEELFVHPNCHRKGIATALFKKTELECRGPVISVNTTGYGKPFYESMGMRVVGRIDVTFGPLEGKELIRMEKMKQ
jgi:GNAT superfamily N-acetyltransferase